MAKPRVLVFVDWYRPGYKGGGPVRSIVNLVDNLGERVDFHIVTSDTDYTAIEPYPGVVPDRWSDLPTGERVWYASRVGRTMNVWRRLLAEGDWDAVYINGTFSLWYSIIPLWLLRASAQRRIVAARGMLLPGPMSQGAFKKHAFMRIALVMGLFRGVEFQATSADEEVSISRYLGASTIIHRVSNLPRKPSGSGRPMRRKDAGEARLVNVVRIATEKNIHLIISSLQHVRGRVVFELYGPIYHMAYWERCQEAVAALPANITFHYHGPIPSEQVPEVLAGEHHALFMPNQGDNYGHTMVEAMCAGLLLLISDNSPWRSLEAQNIGWDLPLHHLSSFTKAVQRIVDMDQDTFDLWSTASWTYGQQLVQDPVALDGNLELFGA